MGIFYATREQIKAAANINGTSEDAAIDRLALAVSEDIERNTGRHFYPKVETRYYDYAYPTYLNLDADLLEITTLTNAGVVIAEADYFLYPPGYGPPYYRIDIDGSSSARFTYSTYPQRATSILGVWGFPTSEAPASQLDGGINSSVTSLDVDDASLVGVGDLLHVDDERLVVTGRSLKSTTATLSAGIDELDSTVLIPVDSGAKLHRGEIITIDAERMFIEDIAGNNLIVRRAYDGSTLAAHLTAAVLYSPRTLSVERAAAGTTAASHSDNAAITRNVPPGLITELVIAEVVSAREQEKSGYARNIGQGDGVMELRSVGLGQLRKQVINTYRDPVIA